MNIKTAIYQFGLIKSFIILIVVLLSTLFIFKDKIIEHKYTKAKIELLKRMSKTTPDQWDDAIKEVYDSMLVNRPDTIGFEPKE